MLEEGERIKSGGGKHVVGGRVKADLKKSGGGAHRGKKSRGKKRGGEPQEEDAHGFGRGIYATEVRWRIPKAPATMRGSE